MHRLVLALVVLLVATADAAAVELPPGFGQTDAITGLQYPTAVRFAPDGRVFAAEKNGRIKVFDSLADPTAEVFADLRTQVHNVHDRGLMSIELHPEFPAEPWVYVLYARDAAIGGTAPRWFDLCRAGGCAIGGRLSRLRAEGNQAVGEEQVLIEDWCQQFSVHSLGDLHFGVDGALYASAGEGAHPDYADHGQGGDPPNPCGDPPQEGGSMRSQDLASSGDPVGLGGSIIRIDPETGAAAPGNPHGDAADANARRTIGHGLRNPYRFAVRPGTDQLWVADVGRLTYEEIDVVTAGAPAARNYGWPCFEGPMQAFAGVPLCDALHASGTATPAWLAIQRQSPVSSADTCAPGNGSLSGIAFAPVEATPYPPAMRGALFFADYGRQCVWYAPVGADGWPDPAQARTFARFAGTPVQLVFGPGGELFWLDVQEGALRRISYGAGNAWPSAIVDASSTEGDLPLTVTFDGSRSSDPDGDALTYAWDLDGDGAFDDGAGATATREYTDAGAYAVKLRVTDPDGATATASVTIAAGGDPPEAAIGPLPRWSAGEELAVTGSAVDAEDGELPAGALSWQVVLQHCPSACHPHELEAWEGAGRPVVAPEHEYPSRLELRLTATDSTGMRDTATAVLFPETVELSMRSDPAGVPLAFNGAVVAAPFARTVVRGTPNTIAAPAQHEGQPFLGWSDGGGLSRDVTASADAAYTARYRIAPPREEEPVSLEELPPPALDLIAPPPDRTVPLPAIGGRLEVPRRIALRTLLRRGLRVGLRSEGVAQGTVTVRDGARRVVRRAEPIRRAGVRALVLRLPPAERRRLRARRRPTTLTVSLALVADGRAEALARRVRVLPAAPPAARLGPAP